MDIDSALTEIVDYGDIIAEEFKSTSPVERISTTSPTSPTIISPSSGTIKKMEIFNENIARLFQEEENIQEKYHASLDKTVMVELRKSKSMEQLYVNDLEKVKTNTCRNNSLDNLLRFNLLIARDVCSNSENKESNLEKAPPK
eukprot:Pgem_evm1s9355